MDDNKCATNPLTEGIKAGNYPASKEEVTGDGNEAEPAVAGRVRRRSTSSRSSRSMRSIRRNLSRSTRSSSSDRYYRRSRYRHSRSRNRSRTRSRSRSSPYHRRHRSSRTPSYRPLARRRFYGRPRRFSPPPRRGGGGGRGGPPNTSAFARSPARAHPSSRTRLARSPVMQRSRPANSPPPVLMPPLSERFEALVRSTLRQGRREYGVLGGLAYLVLTNRPKLPLPTLMREAKELSVVIDRNLPPEIADPNAEVSFNLDFGIKFVIPFPRNAGIKPVFDRPEIPVYKTAEDEKKIVERVAAALAAEAAENRPGPRRSSDAFPDIANNSSVMSERADRLKRSSAFSRLGPSNPLEVPKGSAYFMHDDRDEPFHGGRRRNSGDASYSRRRRNGYIDYGSSRRRRNDREGRWGGDRSSQREQPSNAVDDGQWRHDKFLELEEGEKGGGAKNGRRSQHSSHTSASPSNHHSDAN
ncbi:hypothetical protein Aperf_G00000063700 [Anoplocephala perfoliata]